MTKTPLQQVKYFYNIDSKMLYKVVNSKYVTTWYHSKSEWSYCATSARNILDAYYVVDMYDLVDERNLAIYK